MSRVSEPFPSPTIPADSRTEVFLRYLDFFRSRVTAKIQAMPDAELRSSRLPSGWTPLELVKHRDTLNEEIDTVENLAVILEPYGAIPDDVGGARLRVQVGRPQPEASEPADHVSQPEISPDPSAGLAGLLPQTEAMGGRPNRLA
jgi:hypothetical protein